MAFGVVGAKADDLLILRRVVPGAHCVFRRNLQHHRDGLWIAFHRFAAWASHQYLAPMGCDGWADGGKLPLVLLLIFDAVVCNQVAGHVPLLVVFRCRRSRGYTMSAVRVHCLFRVICSERAVWDTDHAWHPSRVNDAICQASSDTGWGALGPRIDTPYCREQLLGDAVHYRIATGPHPGGKAFTLRTVPPATTDDKPSTAHEAGFSIDAGTVCQEHEREKLQRLCRYVARPPVSNERLSVNEHSQVVYKLKHPFRNGTTHVVMDPLAFIARLAALVPRPRVNLTRYHGVFAPNFKHRKLIVLRHPPSPRRDPHNPLAPLTWMQRLKRVFNIDIETCPHCGGTLRVIASIEDPTVIETILAHIALRDRVCDAQPRAPPPAFDDNDAVHLF